MADIETHFHQFIETCSATDWNIIFYEFDFAKEKKLEIHEAMLLAMLMVAANRLYPGFGTSYSRLGENVQA